MKHRQEFFHRIFDNGLVLLAQSMPWLQSSAFCINVPAGSRYESLDRLGLANFVCEMMQRGCGNMDSRQFVEALESNGIDFGSTCGVFHMHFGGASRAENLEAGIQVFSDVLRRPHLPVEQLEDARQVCLQESYAIQDDLMQRVMIELRRRHYGQPDGRDSHGTPATLQDITYEDIHQFWQNNVRPNGTVISVAGRFDWLRLSDRIEQLFADWPSARSPSLTIDVAEGGVIHIPFESQQTQIALAYKSVPYSHPDYYQARGSVGVLSEGMSSRLFHEVRERRGLCYSVFASCHSLKDRGCVICFSATSADRAQATLNVLVEQLTTLRWGIQIDELRRLKIQIRSGLIMQQESCRSRANALASDWYHLGRMLSLDEILAKIENLTVDSINHYLAANPPCDFDLVTLGPEPLSIPTHATLPISA